MDFGSQTRNDLQILLRVYVFAINRDLGALRLPLLLSLADLDPLLSSEVLAQLGEGVGGFAQAL